MKNKVSFISDKNEGPIEINALNQSDKPVDWLRENKKDFQSLLNQHGGVLLRDFNIHSLKEFNEFSLTLSPNLLEYENRSTPRTKLGERLYTATEYPSDRSIPLHNENSYSNIWPNVVVFFCVIPPEENGFTPIASSANILQNLDTKFVARCEAEGIKYVRNYYSGLDLSWQEVFQTSDKQDVDKYCEKHGIEFEWLNGQPELVTRQTRPATIVHKDTGKKTWFNQAHLFHPTSLSRENRAILDDATNGLYPRNAYYGNGDVISDKDINSVLRAYEQEQIKFEWRRGDILILDNILMAHGRTPFTGKRKIAVSMY